MRRTAVLLAIALLACGPTADDGGGGGADGGSGGGGGGGGGGGDDVTDTPDAAVPAGQILWSYSYPLQVESGPALAADGTVIVHGKRDIDTPEDGPTLFALSSSGEFIWGANTNPATVPAAPASITDSTVAVSASTPGGDLHAKLYRHKLSDGGVVPPVQLVGPSGNGVAIDPDGAILTASTPLQKTEAGAQAPGWTRNMVGGGKTGSNPAIAPDGTIYVAARGLDDHNLHAVNPNGSEKWSRELSQATVSPIAVDDQSRAYVVDGDGLLSVYESNGDLSWSIRLPSNNSGGGVIVGPDYTVYVGSLSTYPGNYTGEFMYALKKGTGTEGEIVWQKNIGLGSVTTTAALSANGTLYVADYCREMFALDAATGDVKWSFRSPELPDEETCMSMSSPTIGPDGLIYFYIADNGPERQGGLYVLGGDGSGPADSPWPMEGADATHSHRAQ